MERMSVFIHKVLKINIVLKIIFHYIYNKKEEKRMENIKFKPNFFRRVVAFVIAMTMCLSCGITQVFAAGGTFSGYDYTIDDTGIDTANGVESPQKLVFDNADFGLTISNEASYATEASAINGGKLSIGEMIAFGNNGQVGLDSTKTEFKEIKTKGTSTVNGVKNCQVNKSYVELIPKKNGTFTFKFEAPEGKDFAVAAKNEEKPDPDDTHSVEVIFANKINNANTSPADVKSNDLAKITLSDLGPKSDKDATEVYKTCTAEVKVEAGKSYWFALGGSKMKIKGFSFAAEGGSGDVTESTSTEATTAAPAETSTEATTAAGDNSTEATTAAGDNSTEATTAAADTSTESTTAAIQYNQLGNVDGKDNINANDASLVLRYVLDKKANVLNSSQIRIADVNGDGKVTAYDAAEILKYTLNNGDWTFSKEANNTTEATTSGAQSTEGTTSGAESTEATTNAQSTEGTTSGDQSTEATTEGSEETTGGGSDNGKPTLWVLGDSTVCNYVDENKEEYNFRNGWGMALDQYFDTSKVNIENIAISGRSTRDFLVHKNENKPDNQYYPKYGESNYAYFKEHLKEGDYVLIQFGHNDEKSPLKKNTTTIDGNYGKSDADGGISTAANLEGWKDAVEKGETYVSVADLPVVANSCIVDGKLPSFEATLYKNYIKLAIDEGANPILCTPIVRANGASYKGSDEMKDMYECTAEGTITGTSAKTLRDKYTGGADKGHKDVTWQIKGAASGEQIPALKNMNYYQGIIDVAAYAKEKTGKDVPVIDLCARTLTYWNEYGEAHGSVNDLMANAEVGKKFIKGTKGTDGKITVVEGSEVQEGTFKDGTHLSKEGASIVAGMVADEIGKTTSGLKDYIKTSAVAEQAIRMAEALTLASSEASDKIDEIKLEEEVVETTTEAATEEAVEETTEAATEAEEAPADETVSAVEETSADEAVSVETETPAETEEEVPVEAEEEIDVEETVSDAVEAVEEAVDAAA